MRRINQEIFPNMLPDFFDKEILKYLTKKIKLEDKLEKMKEEQRRKKIIRRNTIIDKTNLFEKIDNRKIGNLWSIRNSFEKNLLNSDTISVI